MPEGMISFAMHVADPETTTGVKELAAERKDSIPFAAMSSRTLRRMAPEDATLRYLELALQSQSAPDFNLPQERGIQKFKSRGLTTSAQSGNHIAKFRQIVDGIPVYASFATVEVDDKNELVSLTATLGDPANVDAVAHISPADALRTIRILAGYEKTYGLAPTLPRRLRMAPPLVFFYDCSFERWRLVYMFRDVLKITGTSDTVIPEMMDYFIDAHYGDVVAEVSRSQLAFQIDDAIDDLGARRRISVDTQPNKKIMRDLKFRSETFDFNFMDVFRDQNQVGRHVVTNPPNPWNPAAVSAHANGTIVLSFLKDVFGRNGIDNQGTPLRSAVNCVSVDSGEVPPVWNNALWLYDKLHIVYGQNQQNGNLVTYAASLDIVAHELFHGVTGSSSRLETTGQPGALNESYSDIFGVIVHNGKATLDNWNWTIGARTVAGGGKMRDMSRPGNFGQFEHMSQYRNTADEHINSGIHNKAAYNLMTSRIAGNFVFTPREIAHLFYETLTSKLSRRSDFADSHRQLRLVAMSHYAPRYPPNVVQVKINAIDSAFAAAGIM